MNKQPDFFKKNLAKLKKLNPKLAYQLTLHDPTPLEFQQKQGKVNLKREYQGQTYYYHDSDQPEQEADEWFKELALTKETVIYVYGIGLGYYYEAAKEWLKKDPTHQLVFLEEDLSVLYRLFETERGAELLKNPQVQIVHFEDFQADKALLNELSWTYILCPFVVSCLKLYGEVNSEGFLNLKHQLSHQLVQKKVLVDEYLQYGIVFFRNFYPNLLEIHHSYLGNELFNQFKNVPAIICGAGPSLKKNKDVLKKLTDQALIFAGGSSLNALVAGGVIPHFGAGVDPNQGQHERLMQTQSVSIPFFYRNRLFHEALKVVKGPHLYLTGSGGYEIASWFENQLGIEGEVLDEGHNVVNFCIEIAHALGCNPIILVGADLAFTDQKKYAEGVINQADFNQEQLQDSDFESQPILRQDINGEPIYTLWKWVTESEWTSEFAENHPEVTLINATEGGLGFKNIPNQTLKGVAQSYLKSSSNLTDRIKKEIAKHSLARIDSKQVIQLLKDFQQSLKRCLSLFDRLIEEMNQLTDKIKRKIPFPESLQTTESALIEMEIDEEPSYQHLLDTFNSIYIRLHHRTIQRLQSIGKKSSLKKIELSIHRLNFLKDVARVNIELIQRSLRDHTPDHTAD